MNKKIIRALALVLIAAMTFSLCSCGSYEEEVIKRASAIPQTKAEIFDYFCKAMKMVEEKNPAVSYKLSQKAKSADSENSSIKAAFPTIAKLMTGSIKESTEYGEDCSKLFPQNTLDLKNIKSANIVDIDDATSRSYTIELTIWEESNPTQENSIFGKIYKITPKDEILNELKKASDYMTIDDYDAQYQVGKIIAVVSKETDRLSELKLEREIRVETEVTGQNTLAEMGTVPLAFTYSSTANYSVNWDDPNTAEVE